MSKLKVIEVIEILSILEILPIVLENRTGDYFLVIVYRMPGPLGSFIDDIISLINKLPTQDRMLIVSDFNLDQMLPEHVAKVDPLIQNFHLFQTSQYSSHIYEGISDLVFDTSNSNTVSSYCQPKLITYFPKAKALNLYII